MPKAYLLRRALYMPWELPQVIEPPIVRQRLTEPAVEDDLHSRVAGIRSPTLAVRALEMSRYMRNQLLRDPDWAGMAHSLELRVPLVAVNLLRRWLSLAVHHLPFARQKVLERADPKVANITAARPKTGFGIPVREWVAAAAGPAAPLERGLRAWSKVVAGTFGLRPKNLGGPGRSKQPLAKRSAVFPGYDPGAAFHPARILVFRFGQLGDTIVSIPALKAVRSQFPEAKITLLYAQDTSTGWVLPPEILPKGLVDEFKVYDLQGNKLWTWMKLLGDLKRESHDTLVYLVPRGRERVSVWRDLTFFRLAGVRCFIGHTGIGTLPRRTDAGAPIELEHEAEHLLWRVQQFGLGAGMSVERSLDLELNEDEKAFAENWLSRFKAEMNGRPLVGIGPSSKWQSKRWPQERFAALGLRLVSELGLFPVAFGGAGDAELCGRLIETWGDGVNAAGALSARESAAVLGKCLFYVGNDTGTMHLAAAVGTRCVGIFSAQDWRGRWYPYGRGHIVLRKDMSCEGCKLGVCIERDIACLRAITVDEVFEACRTVIREVVTRWQPRSN